MSAVDWQPSQISVLRNSCARKKPSRIPASWSQLAKASGLTRERFAMADHLLRLICCPTIGVGGGVDQAGTRRGLFGSIHGSTGSSRGRGRGPRPLSLRACPAGRSGTGGGGGGGGRRQLCGPHH